MIPRIAHFFWSGDTLSWMRYMTLASFRFYNPEWEMHLHRCRVKRPDSPPWETPETQEFLSYNQDQPSYLDRVDELGVIQREWEPPCEMQSPVHASDIFQWHILSTDGGIYSDMDILYVSPVYFVINMTCDGYLCIVDGSAPIGFLASSPENAFFANVFKRSIETQSPGYQSAGCEALMSVMLDAISPAGRAYGHQPTDALINAMRRAYPQLRINNLMKDVVYPWWWDECLDIFTFNTKPLPHNCVGIHWYAGARSSQMFNSTLNNSNFQDIDCAFTTYASKVWDAETNSLRANPDASAAS